MHVEVFFDKPTFLFTYVVVDDDTKKCAIIDSVLGYDMYSGRTDTKAADQIIDYIRKNKLENEWILETHIHADHLTGAAYLKEKLGGRTAIGEHIKKVFDVWVPIFNTKQDTPSDGSQFDHLLRDGEEFKIGNLAVRVMHTPGHTPACITYLVEDCAFVGDSIFMPHLGTARADFPGGSATTLYDSVQKILSLPSETKIYVCHDYPNEGEKEECLATASEHKKGNKMVHDGIGREEYIEKRNKRDATLAVPKLILPSIQTNMRNGRLADPEDNGVKYMKIPLDKI